MQTYFHFHSDCLFFSKKKRIPNAENKDRTGAFWLRNLSLSFFMRRKKDSHYENESSTMFLCQEKSWFVHHCVVQHFLLKLRYSLYSHWGELINAHIIWLLGSIFLVDAANLVSCFFVEILYSKPGVRAHRFILCQHIWAPQGWYYVSHHLQHHIEIKVR